MKNLREILESKTRKELAYLIGLSHYQRAKILGRNAEERKIKQIADIVFKGRWGYPARRKPQMIAQVLEEIGFGNLRPEQI